MDALIQSVQNLKIGGTKPAIPNPTKVATASVSEVAGLVFAIVHAVPGMIPDLSIDVGFGPTWDSKVRNALFLMHLGVTPTREITRADSHALVWPGVGEVIFIDYLGGDFPIYINGHLFVEIAELT